MLGVLANLSRRFAFKLPLKTVKFCWMLSANWRLKARLHTVHSPHGQIREKRRSPRFASHFGRSGSVASLQFTARGLTRFREAVVAWLGGAEDFGIHPEG